MMNRAGRGMIRIFLPLLCLMMFVTFAGAGAAIQQSQKNSDNIGSSDTVSYLRAIWEAMDLDIDFDTAYDRWLEEDYAAISAFEEEAYSSYTCALSVSLLHYGLAGLSAVPKGDYEQYLAAFKGQEPDAAALLNDYGIDISSWEYRYIYEIAANLESTSFTSSGTPDMMMNGERKYFIGENDPFWDQIQSEMKKASLEWNGIQCTSFARWRFYRFYGWGYASRGNGRDVAANLVSRYWDKFTLESDIQKVKAGSIFSKTTGRAMCRYGNSLLYCGHVGFIEKVENGTVYFSDGNITVNGTQHSIRFNETKTIAEWKSWVGTDAAYAVPIQ